MLFSAGNELRAYALREGESWVVGRGEPAEIVLDDRALSSLHARFSLRDGRVLLEDLQSTNGCFVNGDQVSCAEVAEGDLIELGGVEVRVSGRLQSDQYRALSHAAFVELLSDELTRARLHRRWLAVVAVRHADGRGARDAVRESLGPLDKLCSFAPTISLVLLREQQPGNAESWCERLVVATQAQVQIGAAIYPVLAGNAQELLSAALDACHQSGLGKVRTSAHADAQPVDSAPLMLSPATKALYELVSRAARTTLPVLIHGETGSGKELVARAVHDLGPRKRAPFKTLNCGAIPAQLVESVLFGHERGAFTGADRQVPGVFEQAEGGTVFLDEIGELPLPAQTALLRILELRRLVRLGGTREIEVDVRVVAATHRNLHEMVRSKAFREDLVFRLDALTLFVAPLRERKEEILPLAELFLTRARAQWGAVATGFSDDAKDALLSYAFPGNVRQLKNAIERAAVVCSHGQIALEDLPPQVWREPLVEEPAPGVIASARGAAQESLPQRVRAFEINLIREALEATRGNQAQAARRLGVPRRTLASKVHGYGLLDGLEVDEG